MDNKIQSSNTQHHPQFTHAFQMSEQKGHLPQQTAESAFTSSNSAGYYNYKGMTGGQTQPPIGGTTSSIIFSGSEPNTNGKHPYQMYGREGGDMPYNFGEQNTDRDSINIENYGGDAMREGAQFFKQNPPVGSMMSLESQPSAHFYQPSNQLQSQPTERFLHQQQNPVINVQVDAGLQQQAATQRASTNEDELVLQRNAKSSSSIKTTKKLENKKHNLDISPTLGPPSRDSERQNKRHVDSAADMPELSQTTLNDQSQMDNYHTIGDVSGMVSARSNANGLKRGPQTIGQKVGIKIICRIAPTKAFNTNKYQQHPTRQSLSSSRQSSKQALLSGQHMYMEGARNMESTGNMEKRIHSSVHSTAQYIYSKVTSPSAAGTVGKNKGFRASSIDSRQNSEKRGGMFQNSGKSMQYSDKKVKRSGSHMRNFKSKESLIQSGGVFKHTASKQLNDEGHYSIFTTRNPSRFVLACDHPYSGRILNETLQDIEDVQQLQIHQQNSLGEDQQMVQPVIFKFDGVHDETIGGRQDKIYKQNVQPIVHSFIEGQSGTVLLFGPSASGKTYTLKGGQGSERGLVPRAVDEILQLTKSSEAADHRELDKTPNFINIAGTPRGSDAHKIFLKVSIYMITNSKIVDLIATKGKYSSFANSKERDKGPHLRHYFDQQQNAVMSQVVDLAERLILCPEDFYIALADAFRCRKELSLSEFRDKDIRKKTHFIIGFTLMQQQNSGANQKFAQISHLNFVELSGSEQAVNPSNTQIENIRDTVTQQFVSKSFNSLSCHLMKLVQRKRNLASNNQKPNNLMGTGDDDESKLVACLRQSLTAQSNVLLINCVEPSPVMVEHSLPSLKFCSSLREHIKKKMKRVPKDKKNSQNQQQVHGRKGSKAPKSKSRSRSKSKQKDGSSKSKSARKKTSIAPNNYSNNGQQPPPELEWSRAIEGKIDSLKINFINQEQYLENGAGQKDANVIKKLGDLLLESQALQKEIENQHNAGNFKEQYIQWGQLTDSISYLHNKIMSLICQYSTQQHHPQQSTDGYASTQPVTERQTANHTAQPSQSNINVQNTMQSDSLNSQNKQLSSNYLTSQGTQQAGRLPRVSIPSTTQVSSSQIQTTNPTFSVAANTRNSEFKMGTTIHTGTNQEHGSLLQGSIDNRRTDAYGGMNNNQIYNHLGPIMSERGQSSDGKQLQTIVQQEQENVATQRYENNETFSDLPNQGSVQNLHYFNAPQVMQQQQENPYKNNFSNRKDSVGIASNSGSNTNYESYQNTNVTGFQGIGFVNQQFNTVDNRQVSDIQGMQPQMVGQHVAQQYHVVQQEGQMVDHIPVNNHSRVSSRSRANMNHIWPGNNHQMGQQQQQMQQEGGTFYRSDRENSHDRYVHPHLNQQQNKVMSVMTNSSGQKMYNNQQTIDQSNKSSAFKPAKYKNLIQTFESKFSQIRRDIVKPEFIKESDLPDQSTIMDELKANGNDFKMFEDEMVTQLTKYFDELRGKSLTYQTDDELKGDVSRLMLLNDQEGLKLRFLQIYRERDNVITHAKDEIQKVHPIERQKTILQVQLNTVLKHFAHNTEQFTGYLNMIEERYLETESELVEEMREKISHIENLQETKAQLEETIEQLKKQTDDAVAQRQEEHKHRMDTDSKMKEVADENAKLRQNYDVLKEHEMSIIRDCEYRKQQEIKAQQEILVKEREVNAEQFQQIEKMKIEIQELQSKLRMHENDTRLHENEKNSFQGKTESYINEIQNLNLEISSMKQKACEDIELIKIMRQNTDTLKKEKQDLSEKILELQRAVKSNEQHAENQNGLYNKVQSEIKLLEQDLEQLRADKSSLKDQLKNLKNQHIEDLAQKDLLIQKVRDDMEDLNRKNETQKQLIAARNDELINIKAKQFDKVDILQKLSETEGKLQALEDEKNKQVQQKDELQTKCDYMQLEINKQQTLVESKQLEIEKMRQQQENDFDQFDNKFDQLNRQVEVITQDNTQLKEKVQQQREEVRECEKQKAYWREKCRVAEKKGDQINQKIIELENELRGIIFERNQKQGSQDMTPYIRKNGEYIGEGSTFNTLESVTKVGGIGGSMSHKVNSSSRRPPLNHQMMPLSVPSHGVGPSKPDHAVMYDLEQRTTQASNAIRIENEKCEAQIMNNNMLTQSPNEISRTSSVSNSQQQYEANQTKNSEPVLRSSLGQS